MFYDKILVPGYMYTTEEVRSRSAQDNALHRTERNWTELNSRAREHRLSIAIMRSQGRKTMKKGRKRKMFDSKFANSQRGRMARKRERSKRFENCPQGHGALSLRPAATRLKNQTLSLSTPRWTARVTCKRVPSSLPLWRNPGPGERKGGSRERRRRKGGGDTRERIATSPEKAERRHRSCLLHGNVGGNSVRYI